MVFLGQEYQVFGRGAPAGNYAVGGYVGNVAVLAKLAGKVAAHAADRKSPAARKKVVERFFFYRIQIDGGDHITHHRDKFSIDIGPHTAQALGPFFEAAAMCAEAAQHAALIVPLKRLPELCLHVSVPPCRNRVGICC